MSRSLVADRDNKLLSSSYIENAVGQAILEIAGSCVESTCLSVWGHSSVAAPTFSLLNTARGESTASSCTYVGLLEKELLERPPPPPSTPCSFTDKADFTREKICAGRVVV